MKKKIIFIIFMVLMFSAAAFAAVTVEALADTDKKTAVLGDTIIYTVSVNRTGDASQSPRIMPPDFEGFRMSGSQSSSRINIVNGQASIGTSMQFALVAVKSGQVTIKPAKVTFMNPDTKAYETIETKPVVITVSGGKTQQQPAAATPVVVVPTQAIPQSTIKEIRLSLDFRPEKYLPYLILLAVLITAAFFIIRKFRKKKVTEPAASQPVDYKNVMLQKLDSAADLIKTDPKEFYFEVYEVIRMLLSIRHSTSFDELTTQEIIKKLETAGAAKKEMQSIKEILQNCDLVKFADYKPEIEEAVDMYDKVKALISR
ncbi:MAG TPA: BatD family protein [Candidatus Goldiibacteriota bacterium]|nr:BatD family protein [Candidatus Goldiibacteriota bacterium]HPN63709.1 BatD family protein [Candidatus Goldiibacteriota bacterium]HRQ43578.1 BatD family protein [Candidatus Goldiibacteriota bacterium]